MVFSWFYLSAFSCISLNSLEMIILNSLLGHSFLWARLVEVYWCPLVVHVCLICRDLCSLALSVQLKAHHWVGPRADRIDPRPCLCVGGGRKGGDRFPGLHQGPHPGQGQLACLPGRGGMRLRSWGEGSGLLREGVGRGWSQGTGPFRVEVSPSSCLSGLGCPWSAAERVWGWVPGPLL